MTDAPDTAQLNEEAKTLFQTGRYEEAARIYEAAIAADTGKAAVYYSNLAAAYLKLQRFDLAQRAAHDALLRDCRSLKARYRRAMARRGLGLLPHCLVDLSGVLATHPTNTEARIAFNDTLRMHDSAGKPRLSVAEIRRLDFPPAHGSTLTAPADSCLRPSASSVKIPPPQKKKRGKVPCNGCHEKQVYPEEAVYCQKCGTSPYCNEGCKRKDRHLHKLRCPVMAEHKVLLDLSETFSLQQPYFKTVFEKYVARALGPAAPPCAMLLITHLGVVPHSGGTHGQRLSVEQINIVPLHIITADTANSYMFLLGVANMMQKAATATIVPIMFNPAFEVDLGPNEPPDSFSATQMLTVTPEDSTDIESMVEVYSVAFGATRELRLDLDVLYRAIEDEIELDVNNYYGLRA
ncbi:hypothetical protein B0H13DRAFT_2346820 [Mycena leptocephala]|nr:hypothetical protein B0H13DRAFT_2346820 [Mycena leptocephala]